ncbi:hypothetical protein ACFQ0M_00170 [Kitasatospora aburaviensis]
MGRGAWLTAGTGRHRKETGSLRHAGKWLGAGLLLGAAAIAVPALATAEPAPPAHAATRTIPARSPGRRPHPPSGPGALGHPARLHVPWAPAHTAR